MQPVTPQPRASRWRIDARLMPLAITACLFFALVAAGSILYHNFLAPQVFLNLLIDNAFLCIVAVGMTFVILTGGIDLSVGAVVALTTMISASLVRGTASARCVAIPLVLAVGALFGLLHGVLIQRLRLQPFIVTLAGMFLARGLAFLISTESISVDHPVYQELASLRIPLGFGSHLDRRRRRLRGGGGRHLAGARDAVRPHRLCRRRRRSRGAPDGTARGPHRGRRLSAERTCARRWPAW